MFSVKNTAMSRIFTYFLQNDFYSVFSNVGNVFDIISGEMSATHLIFGEKYCQCFSANQKTSA